MWTNTQIAKFIGPSVATHGDDRLGLGYGQLDQVFRGPQKSASTFPYTPPDQLDDESDYMVDPEDQEAVISKVPYFQKTDSLAYKKANRLYYAGAATQLSACFERPESVMSEIIGVGRGLVPIPGLYGGRADGPAVGGTSSQQSFNKLPFRRTGTTQGWAGSPPPSKVEVEDVYDEEGFEDDIYSLLDLAKLQRRSLGEYFLTRDNTYERITMGEI